MKNIKAIVVQAQTGDQAAYVQLMHHFKNMAYGTAYSYLNDFHLAEDVTQEAFLEAHQKLDTLKHAVAFPNWFRKIVLKHCDRLTRKKRVNTVPLADAENIGGGTIFDPERLIEESELKKTVLDAIQSLPEHQRITTTLFYIDDYSQREISEFLAVTITTVKKRLYDSKQKLKEKMMSMIETTLKEKALQFEFARNLIRFPFPKMTPEILINDLPDENDLQIECVDARSAFVPLVENGKCDWPFYDRPTGILTGVYEYHVISTTKWHNGQLFRTWSKYTDFRRDNKLTWGEEYFLVENNTLKVVTAEFNARKNSIVLSDYRWPGDEKAEVKFMHLRIGLEDPDGDKVVSAANVRINNHTWKCLKIIGTGQKEQNAGKPTVYFELFVAENGRTVLLRRFNARHWRKPDQYGSYESLAGEQEITYEGINYRHFYDCVPDFVFEY